MKPIGPRRKAPPVARPEGFEAPYDAFEPRFKDHDEIVLVIFGIETRSGDSSKLKSRLLDELQRVEGPAILEHGAIVDGFGPSSEIWFAYWKVQEQYELWLRESEIESLFADATLLDSDIGLWREYCLISLDYNETSYSRSDNISGLGNFSDAMEVTPHHAYWGSARDRIVAAAEDDLAGAALENRAADGFGRRFLDRVSDRDQPCGLAIHGDEHRRLAVGAERVGLRLGLVCHKTEFRHHRRIAEGHPAAADSAVNPFAGNRFEVPYGIKRQAPVLRAGHDRFGEWML